LSYETAESLKQIVEESISRAESLKSKIPAEVANLRGFSSQKIRHLLNNLCSFGECKYLELGVWSGSTLIPALYKNDCEALGIDNFSQFQEKEAGFNGRDELNDRLNKYTHEIQANCIWPEDCFDDSALSMGDSKKWNVFMYDGDHSAEATQKAIELYGKKCAQPFILVVDDFDLAPSIWQGLQKALNSFTIHHHREFKKETGWHMGLWVGVLEVVA
jgi:hypothetical protein